MCPEKLQVDPGILQQMAERSSTGSTNTFTTANNQQVTILCPIQFEGYSSITEVPINACYSKTGCFRCFVPTDERTIHISSVAGYIDLLITQTEVHDGKHTGKIYRYRRKLSAPNMLGISPTGFNDGQLCLKSSGDIEGKEGKIIRNISKVTTIREKE